MEMINTLLGQIQYISGAHVDRNFGQGYDAVVEQLGDLAEYTSVDNAIEECQQKMIELNGMFAPHLLPDDYVFFLEHYGGLEIEQPFYCLELYGIGPKVLEWYEYVLEENTYDPPRNALFIGHLSFDQDGDRKWVVFCIDMAGITKQYSIIAIGPGQSGTLNPFIAQDNDFREWRKMAESFPHFLKKVVTTAGVFDYLSP